MHSDRYKYCRGWHFPSILTQQVSIDSSMIHVVSSELCFSFVSLLFFSLCSKIGRNTARTNILPAELSYILFYLKLRAVGAVTEPAAFYTM